LTRRRLILTVEAGIASFLVLAISGWFAVQHSLHGAFAHFDPSPLVTVVKKALADRVVIKRSQSALPAAAPQGYLVAYQENTDIFQTDAKLFDTWLTAILLGIATFKDAPQGNWIRSSSEASYVQPAQRLDPWGHTFCLLRRADTLVIISAGPAAPTSPSCKNVPVEAAELAKVPHRKLLQSPAGSLILVLDATELAVKQRTRKP
jgi:hypothetical protein